MASVKKIKVSIKVIASWFLALSYFSLPVVLINKSHDLYQYLIWGWVGCNGLIGYKLFIRYFQTIDVMRWGRKVALIETDEDWVITKVNHAAVMMFGLSQHRLSGKNFTDLISPDEILHESNWSDFIDRNEETQLKLFMQRKNNIDFVGSVFIYPINRNIIGRFGTKKQFGFEIMDITHYQKDLADQQKLSARFKKQSDNLKSVNEKINKINNQLKESSSSLESKIEDATSSLKQSQQEALEQKEIAIMARIEADGQRLQAETYAKELESLDKLRISLLQNISHELRTPLTLILNPLENLYADQPTDPLIHMATKNTRRLLRLVNQLLDFQSHEFGSNKLDYSSINLARFLQHCGDYFSAQCGLKNIDFTIVCDGRNLDSSIEPTWIKSNIDALEKIIFNYLGNALKHTNENGSIELGFALRDSKYRIYVRDNGPGISEENQKILFNPLSKFDQSSYGSNEGSGLGLAVVKTLSEKLGGEVGVISEQGKGSTFWADFEFNEIDHYSINILLVSDDFSFRDRLLEDLKVKNSLTKVQVFSRSSIESAVEVMDHYQLKLVVSDLELNNSTGLDLMRECTKRSPSAIRFLRMMNNDIFTLESVINEKLVHRIFPAVMPFENSLDSLSEVVVDIVEAYDISQPITAQVDLLIVTDDTKIRNKLLSAFSDIFSSERVNLAFSIEEAKSILSDVNINCCLIDYDMENANAIMFLSEVQKLYPETTRVLITGSSDLDIVNYALSEGCVEKIFYKPIDNDLIQNIEEMVKEKRNQKEPQINKSSKGNTGLLDVNLDILHDIEKIENHKYEISSVESISFSELQKDRGKGVILVVDEDPDMRSIITNSLKKKEYKVFTSDDGYHALDIAEKIRPDIVITDWMMSKMSGPVLIQRLAKIPSMASTPTILLTAKNDEETRIASISVGATIFLGKPFNELELLSHVTNLFKLRNQERELTHQSDDQINIEIVGNLAHRINNPMHHILSVQDMMLTEINNIDSMNKDLLSGDEEALALRNVFDAHFTSLRDHISMAKVSVRRSYEALDEIYHITGINGFELNLMKIGNFCDMVLNRLEETIGKVNVERINLEINNLESQQIISNHHTLLVAIEKAVKTIYVSTQDKVSLEIDFALVEKDKVVNISIRANTSFEEILNVDDLKIINLLLDRCSASIYLENVNQKNEIVFSIPTDLSLLG